MIGIEPQHPVDPGAVRAFSGAAGASCPLLLTPA